jgi:hypothetical protein
MTATMTTRASNEARVRRVRACPRGPVPDPDHPAEAALRQAKLCGQPHPWWPDNVWLATDRHTTLGLRWSRDVDFGHGFWTPTGRSLAGSEPVTETVRLCDEGLLLRVE